MLNYHLHHINILGASKNISYSWFSLNFFSCIVNLVTFLHSLSNFVVLALLFWTITLEFISGIKNIERRFYTDTCIFIVANGNILHRAFNTLMTRVLKVTGIPIQLVVKVLTRPIWQYSSMGFICPTYAALCLRVLLVAHSIKTLVVGSERVNSQVYCLQSADGSIHEVTRQME